MSVDSVAFYRDQADDFFARTVDVDAEPLYEMFLPHVPVRPDLRGLGTLWLNAVLRRTR